MLIDGHSLDRLSIYLEQRQSASQPTKCVTRLFHLFFIQWRRPPRLDIDPLVVYGSSSTEKDVQAKRERTVLQEIFFSAAMIPDTPKEPDMEAVEYVVPKTIPLEDVSCTALVNG